MGKSELMELPVNQWAEDQSFLWLWATNSKDRKTGEPILKTAFDLMEEWGPRLDVFARQVREGYDGWGNQYGSLTTEEKRPRTLRHAEDYENRLQA